MSRLDVAALVALVGEDSILSSLTSKHYEYIVTYKSTQPPSVFTFRTMQNPIEWLLYNHPNNTFLAIFVATIPYLPFTREILNAVSIYVKSTAETDGNVDFFRYFEDMDYITLAKITLTSEALNDKITTNKTSKLASTMWQMISQMHVLELGVKLITQYEQHYIYESTPGLASVNILTIGGVRIVNDIVTRY